MENTSVELPEDLQSQILSWMPLKSLMKFMCVSKNWATIIRSKIFEDLHYARSKTETMPRVLFASGRLVDANREIVFYSVDQKKELLLSSRQLLLRISDEPQYEISAPIRGLICLKSETNKVVICNPGTRKVRTLPEIKEAKYLHRIFLGYVEDTKVYKVLCIAFIPSGKSDGSGKHQAFTMGLGEESWRPVGCKHDHYPVTNGVWKGEVLYYGACSVSSLDNIVMSFNIRSEELNAIDFPMVDDFTYSKFVNYKGNVALVKNSVMTNLLIYNFLTNKREIKMLVRDEISGTWLEDRIEIPPLKEIFGDKMFRFEGTIGTGELVFALQAFKTDHDAPPLVYYNNGNHEMFEIDGRVGGSEIYAWAFFNHVDSLAFP